MVIDSNDNVIFMSGEEALTYDGEEYTTMLLEQTPEVDDELCLAIVPKQTIMDKYGVHCDPKKNSFHESLYNQFESKGRLSEKQVNALRNSR